MKIDQEKCTRCEACRAYCPVGAIIPIEDSGGGRTEIVQDECVECGVCLRSEICPADAIYQPELTWPRSIRAEFSNPLTPHQSSNKEGGRGTEEMKTNDVTGRFKKGITGVSVEMGRPGIGTTFNDLQRVSMALAKLGVEFEPQNPVTFLIVDKKTGKINEDVRNEKVLSAILEFKIEDGRLEEALKALKTISTRIDTVFSLGVIVPVSKDGGVPIASIAGRAGFIPRPNAKVNVGLGRPLKGV